MAALGLTSLVLFPAAGGQPLTLAQGASAPLAAGDVLHLVNEVDNKVQPRGYGAHSGVRTRLERRWGTVSQEE